MHTFRRKRVVLYYEICLTKSVLQSKQLTESFAKAYRTDQMIYNLMLALGYTFNQSQSLK